MPRAANGTYALPSGYSASPGTTIYSATQHNALWTDVRDQLNADFAVIGYTKSFKTLSLLLADTSLSYSTIQADQYIFVLESGEYYKVALSSATDHNATTAGGVKLYRITRTSLVLRSPYDYGATPGSELSVDNKAYIDDLMDACAASWDATYKCFTMMPTGLGRMWRCDGGTRMVGQRQPGMIIRDFGLYVSGAGGIGFDVAGSAWLTFQNCHVQGDLTTEPAVGFLYGLDNTLAVASRISLYNCSTLGAFSKAGRVNIASETSLEVGCRWWNSSRSITAVASAAVDHMGAIDDHLGGLTSPNTTLLQSAQGHRSFVLHDWGTTQHIRQTQVNLTVESITKGSTTTVEVTTGTLTGSGLSNGDTVFFYTIAGMVELKQAVFTVTGISGDTFVLQGVDSTSYSDFTSGTVRNQTGPAMLLAGPQALTNGPAYTLAYGSPHIIVDNAQVTGGNPNNTPAHVNLLLQCEPDPITIVDIYQGSTSKTFQNWNLELLGSAHSPGDAVYSLKDSADVIFHGGHTKITRMADAPTNGIFDDPSLVSLWLHGIAVPLEAALNDPADYALYRVREEAYDRAPDRVRDYEIPYWHGIPEFVQTAVPSVAARVRLDEASAASGPYFDLIRNSASPAASDFLGRVRMVGDNAADEETEYASFGGQILVTTDGAESGRLTFFAITGGVLTAVGHADTNGLASRGSIVQTQQTATTAQLAAIGDAVNTTRKAAGKMVWNTDTSKPCWAVGGGAGNVWVNADGTTAHTPV